jgi:hypothetical protein
MVVIKGCPGSVVAGQRGHKIVLLQLMETQAHPKRAESAAGGGFVQGQPHRLKWRIDARE